MPNKNMSPVEEKIVRQLLKKALERGWVVSVNNGVDWEVKKSSDLETIVAGMATTSYDTIALREDATKTEKIGHIWLIWGNEEDVISDYSADNAEIDWLMEGIN